MFKLQYITTRFKKAFTFLAGGIYKVVTTARDKT